MRHLPIPSLHLIPNIPEGAGGRLPASTRATGAAHFGFPRPPAAVAGTRSTTGTAT